MGAPHPLNDDTREVFSPGYQESLDYVVSTLREAGYNPKVTPFNFPFWKESRPPVLNMVSPTPKTYVAGDAEDSDLPTADFITMANSPTKELTNAPVSPVGGIVDPPTGGSASGCAYDPRYHELCNSLSTVLTGVPPISAGGLDRPLFPTNVEKKAAARKMKGGSLLARF